MLLQLKTGTAAEILGSRFTRVFVSFVSFVVPFFSCRIQRHAFEQFVERVAQCVPLRFSTARLIGEETLHALAALADPLAQLGHPLLNHFLAFLAQRLRLGRAPGALARLAPRQVCVANGGKFSQFVLAIIQCGSRG